ncbi:MAG: cyclase family protein [Armatimonadota bacterium]
MDQHTPGTRAAGTMPAMLVDISRPVAPGVAVWPGDTPYALTLSDWGSVRVGAATLSLHTGTHVDAPLHHCPDGDPIDSVSLDAFLGRAQVIDVAGIASIGPADIGIPLAPRILLRTAAWPVGAPFPSEIPVLTDPAIDHLAAHGVVLLGVDVPSVDRIDSTDLPNHHRLARSGIAILESLDLSDATPGRHTLIALPLRLIGADASPVRALLVPEGAKENP